MTTNMGGIEYDIIAVDRTKEGIDSAAQGVDTLSVKYHDSLTDIALQFDVITAAAREMWGIVQSGFDATVGATLSLADQLKHTSDATGVSVEDLQRLKAAGLGVGVSFESITTTLRMFSQRIAETGAAGETLRSRLSEIGVSVYDQNGNWKDANVLYMEVIEHLNEMPNTFDRNNLALAIFGRNWASIAPLITDYQKAAEAAANASPIDQDTIDSAHDLGIEIDQINAKLARTGQTIGAELLPATREWADLLKNTLNPDSPIIGFFKYVDDFLVTAARGFTILGGSIVAVGTEINQVLHGDFAGAAQTSKDYDANLQKWVAAKQRDDAMRAAGYMTDGMGNVIMSSTTSSPSKYTDPSAAADADKAEKEAEKERVTDLTDAYKKYEEELKNIENQKKKISDLDRNYAEDIQAAGRDVASIRSITMQYNRAKRSAAENLYSGESLLSADATEFNMIKAGVPVAQVPGTSQYTAAQAQASGPLSISIANVNLSKDYPLTAFMSDAQNLRDNRVSMGVPTRP